MNHTVHITLAVRAPTQAAALEVGVGAVEHLVDTFNDDGSIGPLFSVDPDGGTDERDLLQQLVAWATGGRDLQALQILTDQAANLLRAAIRREPPATMREGDKPAGFSLTVRDACILQGALLCLAQVADSCGGDLPDDIMGELPQGIENVGDEASDLAAKLMPTSSPTGVNVELQFFDRSMTSLMTTAVDRDYGAIRYWADVGRCKVDPSDGDVATFEADIIDGPVSCDHPDIPAAEIGRFTCDVQLMREGIRRLLAPGAQISPAIRNDVALLGLDPEHSPDADSADAIVQFAVFGELVFG